MTEPFRFRIRSIRDRRWRRAMMKAIRAGSADACSFQRPTPRHAGIYAIRDFERVNGIAFDPQNPLHVDKIRHMGRDSRFLTIIRKRMGVEG